MMPFSLDSLLTGFMPHGYCLRWDTPLVVLWVSANIGIAIAYFAIPFALRYFVRQRKDLAYPHMFRLFAAFILSCGVTHIVKVVTIWYPIYWIEAVVDAWTAVISLLTAFLLFPLIPRALSLRSARELDEANQKLQAANNELASLNAELASTNEALKVARDQALEASSLKSAFIANISHELRTPLSGVLGMNELMLTTNLDDDQKTMATTIRDSARTLLSLVNDILDLSKIEAGKMTLESIPMQPRDVVRDVVNLLSTAAENKHLTLDSEVTADVPERVLGDPVRTHQILLNLVGNAVKFTNAGRIHVSVSVVSRDESVSVVRFEVDDTGIGIAPEARRLLFMPFVQGDMSTTRRYGGTGLGLTISKRLVEMMGGQIDFESENGKGTKFWFTIPYSNGKEELFQIPSDTPPESFAERARVLVVEDNPTMQTMVARQLAGLGVNYRVVGSGEEALDELSRGRYGMILMDCQLPGMDGFEATARIRLWESGSQKHIPIVAMTASAMKGHPSRCMDAGMDDYLPKPYTLSQMKEKLEKWLPKAESDSAVSPARSNTELPRGG